MDNEAKRYYEFFRVLRYEYSDEIPTEIVHSKDGKYKVRSGWFHSISLGSQTALDSGLLDEECAKIRESFIAYLKSKEIGKNQRRTTREDIETGNRTLDKFIAYLEQHQDFKNLWTATR